MSDNVLSHSHWGLGQFFRGVGGGVIEIRGGGVVKKRQSPDFRSPEVGFSAPVNCPQGDMVIRKKGLNLLLKLPTLTYNLNWYIPIIGHHFKFSNKHPVFKPSYQRNKAEDSVGYQGPCKHNVQNALSKIMPIFHFTSFILFCF